MEISYNEDNNFKLWGILFLDISKEEKGTYMGSLSFIYIYISH